MISESEVERFVQEPGLLVELCREVVKGLGPGSGSQETAAMETQLREIARTIDKLEKQGVPVPEALRAEKMRLVAALSVNSEAARTLNYLTDELEVLVNDLKSRVGRVPSVVQTRKRRTNSVHSPRTRCEVFRRLITEALKQLAGKAQKDDIYKLIETDYANSFLPGDFDYLPDGKRIAWKYRCDWELTKMRKEGLLKSESPRGIWELSEEH